MSSLCTNRHNKATCSLAHTLLSHPTSRHVTLIHVGTYDNHTPKILSFPCSCSFTKCNFNSQLRPNILSIEGKCPMDKPPCSPSPPLPCPPLPQFTLQFIEFTYCNDRLLVIATACVIEKHPPLSPTYKAFGWQTLHPLIIKRWN